MPVLAIYRYRVKPGRVPDFFAKLSAAVEPRFNSAVMAKNVRVYQDTVPGPESEFIEIHIEYENMSAFGARNDFEHKNIEWQQLFAPREDSPEILVSTRLLTEMD
jgi:hypothetical protein